MLQASAKICSDCMVGKQHREIMPKKSLWRASQQLQLIHAGICGPVKPESHSHKRYLINFIDDYSRKTWVYFLSEKSEAFDVFKRFKTLVEKEVNKLICCLRTDRGGEFTSIEFNQFCSSNGIARQLTASYTPQQNGVAERKNRTVMNMVRSMLSEKQIPREFWSEAVNWATHILNRCPTTALKEVTPEEAWSGNKPSVHYFRVFGCVAYVHVSDNRRSKLDAKSEKCILLGVSEESKAYRLYNPVSRKVITSRDVIFAEDEKWEWGVKNAEQSDVLEWGDEKADMLETDGLSDEEAVRSPDHSEERENAEAEGSAHVDTGNEEAEDSSNPVQGRNRREPSWMQDYVSGEDLLEEDGNLTMFAVFEDPALFEEAVKCQNWREAMKLEMKAITDNET